MRRKRSAALVFTCIISICVLATFKYADYKTQRFLKNVGAYRRAASLNIGTFNMLWALLDDCRKTRFKPSRQHDFEKILRRINEAGEIAARNLPASHQDRKLHNIIKSQILILGELKLVIEEFVNIDNTMRPRKFFFGNAGPALMEEFVGENKHFNDEAAVAKTSASTPPFTFQARILKAKTSHGKRKNVIIILIDTFRADHLKPLGVRENPAPFLSEICAEGVCFTNAHSQSSITQVSVESIFTGLYPSLNTKEEMKYAWDKKKSLVEVFRENGYFTAGISSNSIISGKTGFNYGFDWFKERPWTHAGVVNLEVKRFFETTDLAGKNLFLYLHYIDPHSPYMPPDLEISTGPEKAFEQAMTIDPEVILDEFFRKGKPPDEYVTERIFQKMRENYKKEIVFTDSKIRDLFKYLELEQKKIIQNSIVVILSDHGEEFMEHGGLIHARTLYDESIRVPLILWSSDPESVSHKTVEYPVELVGLMPTIMDIVGIQPPGDLHGRNLLSEENRRARLTYSQLSFAFSLEYPLSEHEIAAVKSDGEKLIHNFDTGETEYYDLKNDPGERENAISRHPKEAAALKKRLYQWGKMAGSGGPRYHDGKEMKAVEQQLRSLGYIK